MTKEHKKSSSDEFYSNFATLAVHSGCNGDVGEPSGIVVPLSSSWVLPDEGDGGVNEDYGRVGNTLMTRLEEQVAALERADYCTVYGSGIAAINSVISTLHNGANVVIEKVCYGNTVRLMKVWEKFGVKSHYIDLVSAEGVNELIKLKPQLVIIESPTNPLLDIIDIANVAKAAHSIGAKVAVDNSVANSYNQQPLTLGADYSIISLTKYHNGHSTGMVGAVCTNDAVIAKQMLFNRKAIGLQPGNIECALTVQGIQTLNLRMERIGETALKVGNFLKNHKKVRSVCYPHLPTHPQYELAKAQMKTGSGVMNCVFDYSLDETKNFVKRLSPLFTLAHSMGSAKTLVCIPSKMSHAALSPEERLAAGIEDGLLRFSIGLEDAETLINHLAKSLI